MAGTAGLVQTPIFHAYLTTIYPKLQARTFSGLVGIRMATHLGMVTPAMNIIMLFAVGAFQSASMSGG